MNVLKYMEVIKLIIHIEIIHTHVCWRFVVTYLLLYGSRVTPRLHHLSCQATPPAQHTLRHL